MYSVLVHGGWYPGGDTDQTGVDKPFLQNFYFSLADLSRTCVLFLVLTCYTCDPLPYIQTHSPESPLESFYENAIFSCQLDFAKSDGEEFFITIS